MRSIPLTFIKGGINRLRVKGGARLDVLYDAVNCHEDDAGKMVRRAGTRRVAELPDETRGLCSFNGSLHTFTGEGGVEVPDGFIVHILYHPDYDSGAYDKSPYALEKIHFAQPFMGFLYVVAEFADGAVAHYWLRSSGTWEANKIYHNGDIIEPTTPNGLAYQAGRLGQPYPSWAPNVPRTDGNGSSIPPDIIEPTVYNDFYYTVVETAGANPTSGSVEPDWPTEEGAQVVEDTDGQGSSSDGVTTPSDVPAVPTSVDDRYGDGRYT